MHKDKKLIPDLRFPEFEKDGEWEKEKLAKISNVIMGASPSSSSYNENKIGLPLLQGNADIKNRLSAPRIYTSEITKDCEIDDILLSVRAPVGTVAKSLHKACIGRGISALRAIKPNSQEYLYQWLFSYESSWHKVSQGGTFDAVNSDDIRNLLVPIPNPKEQQKIASCLSSLDEVIEAHNQKLELLKDHKKGLMQNLFPQEGEKVPKLRFKEFEGEWVEKKLGTVCKMQAGKFVSASDINELQDENLYPCYGGNGLRGYTKSFNNTGVYSLIGRQGALCGNVTLAQGNFYATEHAVVVTPDKNTDTIWLFYMLGFLNLNQYATGQAQPGLSVENIGKIEIKVPNNKEEQQKIASCLSSLDELITAQAEKIEQLKQHKKGLMQGLFPNVKTGHALSQ